MADIIRFDSLRLGSFQQLLDTYEREWLTQSRHYHTSVHLGETLRERAYAILAAGYVPKHDFANAHYALGLIGSYALSADLALRQNEGWPHFDTAFSHGHTRAGQVLLGLYTRQYPHVTMQVYPTARIEAIGREMEARQNGYGLLLTALNYYQNFVRRSKVAELHRFKHYAEAALAHGHFGGAHYLGWLHSEGLHADFPLDIEKARDYYAQGYRILNSTGASPFEYKAATDFRRAYINFLSAHGRDTEDAMMIDCLRTEQDIQRVMLEVDTGRPDIPLDTPDPMIYWGAPAS